MLFTEILLLQGELTGCFSLVYYCKLGQIINLYILLQIQLYIGMFTLFT